MNSASAHSNKSRWSVIGSSILSNMITSLRFRLGYFEFAEGSTHWGWPVEKSCSYVHLVYNDYLRYSGLTADAFAGARILELGPGDNLGVALMFVAAGASQVVALDKFFSKRDNAQQLSIYRALRAGLSPEQAARFDQAVSLQGTEPVFNDDRLKYIYGVGAEEADRVLDLESFDFIISRGVILEIHDCDRAFVTMDKLLRPGGMMIHKLPCLDWVFPQNGHHALEYLTISDRIYKAMANDSGRSNRRMIDYYRKTVAAFGYDAQFHITKVIGSGAVDFAPNTFTLQEGVHYNAETLRKVRAIRPRLLPRFQNLSDEELMIQDMFLITRKTAPAVPAASAYSTRRGNA